MWAAQWTQEARKYLSSERYRLKPKYDYRGFQSLTEYIHWRMDEYGEKRAEASKNAHREIPQEKYYQRKILDALRQEFPKGRFRKVSQGATSQNGEPDIDGVAYRNYIAVEVKRPLLGEATPLQKKAIREIREAGGCSMIASYPEEVIAAIHAYFRGEPYWYELTGCAAAVAEGEDEALE